ncbi:hypothetical protein GH754_12875 [Salinibacillus xinjiangensis]|uniref:Uncharacterized protein n=2 Tax=Salinibacillus xinjiangensis TaxID=1229268 RepID=A0A6G1X8D4_9BACI|nr:hypothetical protein [Salinibacillus xinjiangensis]
MVQDDVRRHMKDLCKNYMNYHVIVQLSDGSQFDGIIDGMDDDGVIIMVPEDVDEGQMQMNRQYGYGYDDYDDYGRPRRRRRFRRFRRRRFPYQSLFGLFGYPYFYPVFPGYYGGY